MRRLCRAIAYLVLVTPAFAETDAFNLGVLGAEGLPIRKPAEELKLPRGSVAIQVTNILEGTPAQGGGLEKGDIIVGVGPTFLSKKMDPIYQFVDLLEQASSRKDAQVTLSISREGKPQAIKLKLPSLGAHAAQCPVGCARCEKLVEESLQFLVSQQAADGSFPIGLGGTNGQVVVTCLAGLAMLASGSTPKEGPYAENIQKAAAWVAENCGKERDMMGERPGGANWNQTNWAYGYSPLFLCEVYRLDPTPELEQRLTEIMQQIEKNQEASGGWAHGPGGPNALNYLELQIVGNFCLSSLGALKRSGFKPSQQVIDKGIAYMIDTSGGDGGIGYSNHPGQKGMGDPGRTALGILGMSLLEQQKHPFYARMSSFFKRTIKDLTTGHVSPVQHYVSAGFACMWLGTAYWKEFMEQFRLEILAARRPDGTFSARPTEESKALHSNTDRELGACWTTASYALILQLPKGKLKLLTTGQK
ncbi:MAG: hypothetical protein HYY18_22895 [Planctomycetes bacterium]|nr:hypothetical protein [Planctomycetota bacterium]